MLDRLTQKWFLQEWNERPLSLIMISAILIRFIAAIFSQGYGMLDDHFLIIEIPWEYIKDGKDWFGEAYDRTRPYVTFHYLLLSFLEKVGMHDQQSKMLVVRIIHAFYSSLSVYFGYRIVEHVSTKDAAKQAGLILALLWILPFMSVRNLVEMACIPPMMAGVYLLVINNEKKSEWIKNVLLAGILFALGFTIRFQTSLMVAGVGLALLILLRWKEGVLFGIGFAIGAFFIQGIWEWNIYGRPFHLFLNYSADNAANAYNYTTGDWYNYLLLIIGILIPPLSLILLYGFIRTWKSYLLLFLPTLIFFAFHSAFPNKQERFILPVVPFIILLGVIGYKEFVIPTNFRARISKLFSGLWIWFWAINFVLLSLFTVHYSKKARAETLYYFSNKESITGLIFNGGKLGVPILPLYYLKKDVPIYLYSSWESDEAKSMKAALSNTGATFPNYAVFIGNENLDTRKKEFELYFSKQLVPETIIEPSLIDHVLFLLNPAFNANQTGYIYQISK